VRRLGEGDTLAALVADQLERYMAHKGRDWTHPHDPLTAAAVVEPRFLRTVPLRVSVETQGEYTRGQTVALQHDATDATATVDVAVDVDVAGFERWLLDTLSGGAVVPAAL